jgi:transcriptional regulator GlxA family with amidase domain
MTQYQQIDRELRQFLDRVRGASRPAHPQIARLLTYVHEHLFEPDLNVKVVKAQCQFYDNNITMRFHNVMGMGLREYIERLRLEAARHLLGLSFPIYVVAMAVGYSYPETFCRAFRRQYGLNPSGQQEIAGNRQIVKKESQEKTS